MANYDMPGSPSNLNDLESSVSMENVVSDSKNLSTESVKAVAESLGIAGLSDEAARDLSEETTYRYIIELEVVTSHRIWQNNPLIGIYFSLRVLLQDAHKFLLHAKRRKLLVEDLDFALKVEGQVQNFG
jgi:transcription initiation factor TFIID subunit 6